MRRPIKTRKDLEIASDHFLRRNSGYPLGVTLAELDYLRGWKDDFFGDAIDARYASSIVGVGSGLSLVDGAHGGWLRLTAGPAAARYAYLWLGDAIGGQDTLDADEGWIQISRMKLSHTTNFLAMFGVYNAALAHYIQAGYSSAVGANWLLRGSDGAPWNNASTVAADTDWHWHVLNVYPITGGRRVDYYLDGSLIASQTANVPATVLTPILISYSLGAAARSMDVDYWAVIPRNL